MGEICGKNGRRSSSNLACQIHLSGHGDLARPKQRWKAQEKEALMALILTQDEDDGGNDDDFSQNRPRIAVTLVTCISAALLKVTRKTGCNRGYRET
jgi:hypothetical protein